MYKNEKGLIIVFFPIVIFNLIFITVDHYSFHEDFNECYEYFKSLYSNRVIILGIIILLWKQLKQMISGYLILFITYVFNILIVFSDIVNIYQFLEKYQTLSELTYYKFFYLKLYINYFFFISWMFMFITNLIRFFKYYKYSHKIVVDVLKEENKEEKKENEVKEKNENVLKED